MRSVPKRHVALTSIPAIFSRAASGKRRVRRETPLVVPAAADLELCRVGAEVPASSRAQPKARPAGNENEAKLQASLRSAYRPKPVTGGTYSVVIDDEEGQTPPPRQRKHRD